MDAFNKKFRRLAQEHRFYLVDTVDEKSRERIRTSGYRAISEMLGIDTMDLLSVRAVNCLCRVSEILGRPLQRDDLQQLTEHSLLCVRHLGIKTLREIQAALAAHDELTGRSNAQRWNELCDW